MAAAATRMEKLEAAATEREAVLQASERTAEALRLQTTDLRDRLRDLEAALQTAARVAGAVEAKDTEIAHLRAEAEAHGAEAERWAGQQAALVAAVRRQEDLEDELERLREELHGRDRTIAEAQAALNAALERAMQQQQAREAAIQQLQQPREGCQRVQLCF